MDNPLFPTFNPQHRLPVGVAAAHGDVEALDEIIHKRPAEAHALDDYLETPLHIAATYGRLEAVKYLIWEHGAPLEAVNYEGWTPLFCAISRGHLQVAEFLLQRGANIKHVTSTGMSVMHVAAWNNQPAAVQLLIAKDAPFRKENTYGCLPIGMARPGPVKRLLFNAGDDVVKR